ncbi:MAG TPA: rhomboid family intramembrane serine protease [Dissulfurispiraceae bacterium]
MLIPYKDDTPLKTVPAITLFIIAVNVYMFAYLSFFSHAGSDLFVRYGAIPNNIINRGTEQPVHPVWTIFFSMFMHGGFLHLIGNMIYLWIFSNSIEDELGHLRFLLFYLFCGFSSVYIYALTAPHSVRPMIGASGAVSGILGAYMLLLPKARIHTLLYLGVSIKRLKIPAFVLIGLWALVQFLSGAASLLLKGRGDIAWFAHLGGFFVGLASIRLWTPSKRDE